MSTRKRDTTFDQLRMSVQKLLLQQRWEDISIQQIASDSQVSIGTFYNYYASKEEALIDVKEVLSRILVNDVKSLCRTFEAPYQKVALMIKYFFSILENHPDWAKYLFVGNAFSDRLDQGLESLLKPVIEAGIEQGQFHCQDIKTIICFIENGVFSLIKAHYEQELTYAEASKISTELTLTLLGLDVSLKRQATQLQCPLTPIVSLPISILSRLDLEESYA